MPKPYECQYILKDKYLIIISLQLRLTTKKRRDHFPAPKNNITPKLFSTPYKGKRQNGKSQKRGHTSGLGNNI